MLLADVAATSEALAATRSRLAKRALLVDLLRRTAPDEVPVVARYLGGELRQRRTGLGRRALAGLPAPAAEPSLDVLAVDDAFERMAGLAGLGLRDRPGRAGRGPVRRRDRRRAAAAGRARHRRPAPGRARRAAARRGRRGRRRARGGRPPGRDARRRDRAGRVRGARRGDARRGGRARWARSRSRSAGPCVRCSPPPPPTSRPPSPACPGRPVVVDAKLDGIRVQVHRDGDDVRVFTRSLDDITDRVPELVAVVRRPAGAHGRARRRGARTGRRPGGPGRSRRPPPAAPRATPTWRRPPR